MITIQTLFLMLKDECTEIAFKNFFFVFLICLTKQKIGWYKGHSVSHKLIIPQPVYIFEKY